MVATVVAMPEAETAMMKLRPAAPCTASLPAASAYHFSEKPPQRFTELPPLKE